MSWEKGATDTEEVRREPLRVLVLEDEPFIAMDLRFAFEDRGAIVSTAISNKEAAAILEAGSIDAAVLDVNLGGGQTCEPIATRLKAAGLPFVLHTGDLDRHGEIIRTIDAPVMPKPTPADQIADRIFAMVDARAAERA